MRKTNTSNEELQSLIKELRKVSSVEKSNFWKRIASDLSKPTRVRRVVNISRIDRFTKENDVIIVPGKVLSSGNLNHKVQIAAYNFSESAKEKIEKASGKIFSIFEMIKSNPKGKGIKIIG